MEFNNQAVIVGKCALGLAETLSRKPPDTLQLLHDLIVSASVGAYENGSLLLSDFEPIYRWLTLLSEVYKLHTNGTVPATMEPVDYQAVKERAKAGRLNLTR